MSYIVGGGGGGGGSSAAPTVTPPWAWPWWECVSSKGSNSTLSINASHIMSLVSDVISSKSFKITKA